MNDAQVELHLQGMLDAVKSANFLIKSMSSSLNVESKLGNQQDVVTQVDKAVEELLQRELKQNFPEVEFYGEEGGKRGKTSDWWWIVDPIDGTTNFVNNFPFFCISVALCRETTMNGRANYQPWIGVIYKPSTDELFYATRGKGAWKQTRNSHAVRMHPSAPMSMETMVIAWEWGSFAHNSTIFENKLAMIRNLLSTKPNVRAVRSLGSAALNLMELAMGRLDAYYEAGIHSWDIAAACLIVQESGGVVSNMEPSAEFDLTQRNIVAMRSPCPTDLFVEFSSRLIWEGESVWQRDS